MKIHKVLLILALISFVAICTGSYQYYAYLKKISLQQTHEQAASEAQALKNRVTVFISENIKLAKILAGFDDVQRLLNSHDPGYLQQVNTLLDIFNDKLNSNVCYIMDASGTTIASSNRDSPESFVGQNYKFRPYFQKSIQGNPGVSIYLALGVTSKIRGVYYSYPVYSKTRDEILGCVVIKADLTPLEAELNSTTQDIWTLTSPHGVIFASNKQEWLFHTFWQVEDDVLKKLKNTRQFGDGPWSWIGFRQTGVREVTDKSGIRFIQHELDVSPNTNWKIIHLTGVNPIFSILSDPLIKNRGVIIPVLLLLVSSLVLSLYFYGRSELTRKLKSEKALRIQNEYLSALHETSLGLINRLQFNELISVIISRAGSLSGTESGVLSLYDPEKDELEIRIGLGVFQNAIGFTVKPGEGFSGKVQKTGLPLIVDDYATWPGRLPQTRLVGVHSLIAIPIMSGGEVSGVIGLGHSDPEKKFGKPELDILSRFAELAAIALDNARLYSKAQKANYELKQIAMMDGLTQIANRRYFDEYLAERWQIAVKNQESLSLIMCDIDYFKLYNDTYGHQLGDQCLKNIASTIASSVKRPPDLVARYGGEEFGVILPLTDKNGALEIADRIRLNVTRLQIKHKASEISGYVTLSIGVSSVSMVAPVTELQQQNLLGAADEALYLAKSNGRNRVEFMKTAKS